jgi:hypothetical protein
MALNPKLRRVLLAAGLAGTAGSVYWASSLPEVRDDDASLVASAPERSARSRSSAAGSETHSAAAGDLDLKRLQRDPSTDPSADLFGPRNFAPAPPSGRKSTAQGAGVAVDAPPPPPPPPPPPVPFSYIGRLAEGAQTTVFLAAGDRNLVVKAGDVIDNTYKIEEIGQSVLVLTYLPQNVKQTMPIGAPQ